MEEIKQFRSYQSPPSRKSQRKSIGNSNLQSLNVLEEIENKEFNPIQNSKKFFFLRIKVKNNINKIPIAIVKF